MARTLLTSSANLSGVSCGIQMRCILNPHQAGVENFAGQSLAVADRLPGIVHDPQAQSRRADLAGITSL
jgi:hypothetical protein